MNRSSINYSRKRVVLRSGILNGFHYPPTLPLGDYGGQDLILELLYEKTFFLPFYFS